jgi:hypothetical protein
MNYAPWGKHCLRARALEEMLQMGQLTVDQQEKVLLSTQLALSYTKSLLTSLPDI